MENSGNKQLNMPKIIGQAIFYSSIQAALGRL